MMIKILFIASNPLDTNKLHLEQEAEAIKNKLFQADFGRLFEFVSEFQVRLDQLKYLLLHHRPNIVHFCGHGNEKGEIILEDEHRNSVTVPPDALNDLFATLGEERRIRCVFLNECFSAPQAKGIAGAIPCVVGVVREIRDEPAIAFAAGFYQAIGFGLSVKDAFDGGRNEGQFQTREAQAVEIPSLVMQDSIDPKMFFIVPVRPEKAPRGSAPKRKLHGKYTIIEHLADGPISKVELAYDSQVDRHVAVKTLVEPAAARFFQQEVREVAKIAKHPNITSIYGAWLDDKPAHYVREYVDGHSLRDELSRERRGALPVDFVLQVLAALGDAMNFAQQLGVWNLGIKAERVLIQKMKVELNLGLTTNYNIVLCPAIGDSEYLRRALPARQRSATSRYFPPESFQGIALHADDFDKANQYMLGILACDMIPSLDRLGPAAAERRDGLTRDLTAEFPRRPGIDESELATCPSFLSDAIRRMTDPNPSRRFETLGHAVKAIAHRDLEIEVARDSFRRILSKPHAETEFFRAFYARLLNASQEIRDIFARHRFPPPDTVTGPRAGEPPDRWPDQFGLLKEAIVLLFAHNLLKEPREPTILTRYARSHRDYNPEYFKLFGDALVETVVEFDKGNYPEQLSNAWEQALEPGLKYMASYAVNHPQH